ncbi:hypothetical protein SCA6_020322 [Theobroma cacao]
MLDKSKVRTKQSLQFDLSTIEAATNNFSDANKIGMGGFGSVYKISDEMLTIPHFSGYISPEYALHGLFSFKSDVYSFGVLTLEIVHGKTNTSFFNSERAENLLSHAWRWWKQRTPLEMMDPTLRDSYVSDEVIRCIQVGLLCVQQNPNARPMMAKIVSMLSSSAVSVPPPQQPAFFFGPQTAGSTSIVELGFDQPTSKSKCSSINEASITEFYPR